MISAGDLKKISIMLFDADGTLTDGRIAFDRDGSTLKFFDVRDFHWLKLARRAGLKTGIISGRDDDSTRRFAAEAGMDFIFCGVKNKGEFFREFIAAGKIDPATVLYMGDDVVDMPVMRMAGTAVAVNDAVPEVFECCHRRTRAAGGRGAAGEIIREVLHAKDLLNQIMERYRQ